MASLSPEQFIARIQKQPPAAAHLFLGPEGYYRRLCREALIARCLPEEARAEGLTQVDLEETTVTEILDDARSLSLFATERVIWVTSAELALPRRLAADDDEATGPGSELAAYLRQPTPGTVIVFVCSRYEFTGEDKPRLDRVQRFYAEIPNVVEFRPLNPESSRSLAQDLAQKHKLKLAGAELVSLLEAVAGDANRLNAEIEKLSLFVEAGQAVSMSDLQALVPNAAQTTIFNLVNALGRRDRASALMALDILVRNGEYLPLALTFLGTQFRLALAAKEAHMATAQQAQAAFSKMGVRIWRERAEQVMGTAGAFTREQLSRAIAAIYQTDKKFRDGMRDDRIVMEGLVLALTQK